MSETGKVEDIANTVQEESGTQGAEELATTIPDNLDAQIDALIGPAIDPIRALVLEQNKRVRG